MDNTAESRSECSAGNKKSDENPHLSDEKLLFELDGELSASESAQVGNHLQACWSCRARSEQIEEAIANVVEYRDLLATSFGPISTGGRAEFVTQLQQLSRSVGNPTLRSRIVGTLRALPNCSSGALPRHAAISGLAMSTLLLLLFARPWEVRKVCANQLLENAQVSEVRALHGVTRPVVYQKLNIRIGNEAVMRTIYRDLEGVRQTDRVDVSGQSGDVSNGVVSPSQLQERSESMQSVNKEIEQTFSGRTSTGKIRYLPRLTKTGTTTSPIPTATKSLEPSLCCLRMNRRTACPGLGNRTRSAENRERLPTR